MNESDLCESLNFISFSSPSKLNNQEGFVCVRVWEGRVFFVCLFCSLFVWLVCLKCSVALVSESRSERGARCSPGRGLETLPLIESLIRRAAELRFVPC